MQNTFYGSGGGLGTAFTCAEAQRQAREMHASYLHAYGLSALDFPLLRLRPEDWDAPFVEA